MASKLCVINGNYSSIYWTLYPQPCANPHSSQERYTLFLAPFYRWEEEHSQGLNLLPSVLNQVTGRVVTQIPKVGLHTPRASLLCVDVCRPGTRTDMCLGCWLLMFPFKFDTQFLVPELGWIHFVPVPGRSRRGHGQGHGQTSDTGSRWRVA